MLRGAERRLTSDVTHYTNIFLVLGEIEKWEFMTEFFSLNLSLFNLGFLLCATALGVKWRVDRICSLIADAPFESSPVFHIYSIYINFAGWNFFCIFSPSVGFFPTVCLF